MQTIEDRSVMTQPRQSARSDSTKSNVGNAAVTPKLDRRH
jgi:hypothetical protein